MKTMSIRKLPQSKIDLGLDRIRYCIDYHGNKYYAFSYDDICRFSNDFPMNLQAAAMEIIKTKEKWRKR